jgi:hypothetical protein
MQLDQDAAGDDFMATGGSLRSSILTYLKHTNTPRPIETAPYFIEVHEKITEMLNDHTANSQGSGCPRAER